MGFGGGLEKPSKAFRVMHERHLGPPEDKPSVDRMKNDKGPAELPSSKLKIVAARAQVPPSAADDERWHVEMQKIGLRLVGEKASGAPDAHLFLDKRIPAPERMFWSRVRQAYAVLRGRAYARPVRQPR
jgi:hypothetical protein